MNPKCLKEEREEIEFVKRETGLFFLFGRAHPVPN